MNLMAKFFEEHTKREQREKRIRFKYLNQYARKNQIVFAGSSLAEHFPINEMLQNIDENIIVYNRGIGGDTTDNLLESLDLCIFDLEPAKLFINIGTNDMGKADYEEEILMAKYDTILEKIVERLPDTKLYLLSYYPVNPDVDGPILKEAKAMFFNKRTNEAIVSANDKVKELASKYKATYIDVTTTLLDSDNRLDEKFSVEGIHLWPNAYKKVFDILLDYLV